MKKNYKFPVTEIQPLVAQGIIMVSPPDPHGPGTGGGMRRRDPIP